MTAANSGRVVIYGGKGALGSTCVSYFKSKSWWVASIDLAANEQADISIVVPGTSESSENQSSCVLPQLEAALQGKKLDAVVCVAGGWAGGNAENKDFLNNSDLMWKQSVWTSVISANIAAKHLKEGGLLFLTGAKAALEPTPGMIGYGLAKAAVHHLVKSLSADKSGLPTNGAAVAILPVTLDTPMNRKWMPKADTSTWTPLEFVAELSHKWAVGEGRPTSGSLVQLITTNNKTELVPVQ